MFALSDVSRFEVEKVTCKILKPVWDVLTDYLLIFLAMVCIGFAGMEVTSGSFECLPAVDCPGISKPITNSTLLSQIQYRNACEAFYRSQKANTIQRTDVVTDIESSLQYAKFVNSECSKSAIPDFLAYLWVILFMQAFALLILDNLWLKLPITASVIENFAALVMECYASPCPNFALVGALHGLPMTMRHAEGDQQENDTVEMASFIPDSVQSYQLDTLGDRATVSAIKTLYEKVKQLKENIESSGTPVKIWQLYLLQSVLQAVFALTFFVLDIYYMNDLQETMTCTIIQNIPVPHDYFICSHSLAPAFVLGLHALYLPVMGISLAIFISVIVWTVVKVGKKKCEYDFAKQELPTLEGTKVSDIPSVNGDLGFLLHLLNAYNKLYVVPFAHFLSERNKNKMQSYTLARDWPVEKLERKLEENGNKLTFEKLPGIPSTIFELSTRIVTLELVKCGPLKDEDFENFCHLTFLRKLSVIKCGLTCIPEGILKMEWVEELNLKGNAITSIEQSLSMLKNLTVLDLSDNKLTSIDSESIEQLDHLFEVSITGNSKLQMSPLKVVLACKRLTKLECPPHLKNIVHELSPLEQKKFEKVVKFASKRNFVIPYTPEDAPHIDLTNHSKVYKMDYSLKGIAIIFNMFSYAVNTTYRDRHGSEKDVFKLKFLFEEMGFDTLSRTDCTSEEAKKLLTESANNTMYKECGCIAVIIMCHGTEKGLVFFDGKEFPVSEFVKIVQKSRLYEGKPKLFFVQACRGGKIAVGDSGGDDHFEANECEDNFPSPTNESAEESIKLVTTVAWITPDANSNDTNDVSRPNVMTAIPDIPKGADILLSFSTLPGHSSFRNTEHGSWYIHALVEIFSKHAWEEDILSLLTLVNYEVVRAETSTGWRQVPAPQSTLTKKLYLLPGYPSQCET